MFLFRYSSFYFIDWDKVHGKHCHFQTLFNKKSTHFEVIYWTLLQNVCRKILSLSRHTTSSDTFWKNSDTFDQVKSILQENIVTFKTNLNSDNFQTHSTKIQTHTDIFQTHFDKNSDILQDGVKLFLIRLFLSQNVSEFWPKVSEFVWKELPQKGKKSFWVKETPYISLKIQ